MEQRKQQLIGELIEAGKIIAQIRASNSSPPIQPITHMTRHDESGQEQRIEPASVSVKAGDLSIEIPRGQSGCRAKVLLDGKPIQRLFRIVLDIRNDRVAEAILHIRPTMIPLAEYEAQQVKPDHVVGE